MSDTRQRIVASLFSSPTSENGYEAHVKIWEDDENGGRKPRYIILALNRPTGKGKLLKTKLNTTGTFSVGKTWELDALRGVEVHDENRFNITMARTYRWDTENSREQATFLSALVRLFRQTNLGAPLSIVGNIAADTQNPPRTATPPTNDVSAANTLPVAGELPRSSGPPPTNRRLGHARTPSTASVSSGLSPMSASRFSPSPVQPNGVEQRQPSIASPQQVISSIGPDTSSTTRPQPARRTQARPSAISVQDDTPRPPQSPSRFSSGQRSPTTSRPNGRQILSATPLAPASLTPGTGTLPRSAIPPRTPLSFRPSVSASSMTSSPSVPSDTGSSTSRPTLNGSSNFAPVLTSSFSSDTQAPTSSSNHTPRPSVGSLDVPRAPSPARSASSHSKGRRTPSPLPSRRAEIERVPSPATTSSSASRRRDKQLPPGEGSSRPTQQREPDARVPYLDPNNQRSADRFLSQEPPTSSSMDDDELEATLTAVEELLEGFEWSNGLDLSGKRNVKGAANQIETRLTSELSALERANTYSFIESDDRISALIGFIDEAIDQLDQMDTLISSYKIHLNVVSDDISHIQSQGRGLQVQTQNQRALLDELEQLMQTVNVDRSILTTLARERLDLSTDVERMEQAAAELYKALQAASDRDMAASMERLSEYRAINTQFCQNLFEFLLAIFPPQVDAVLNGSRAPSGSSRSSFELRDHRELENALGRYSGLILYLKEMDEERYRKLCGAYFSTASDLHNKQIKGLLTNYAGILKKTSDDEPDNVFSPTPTATTKPTSTLRRAGTVIKSDRKGRRGDADGELRAHEALTRILDQIAPQVHKEEDFMADFLQINDAGLTFADYMSLESYFRRQASRTAGLGQATTKLLRNAMDLIFGFLPLELKQWVEAALQRDNYQIVGMMSSIERVLAETDDRGNTFFLRILDKQHVRTKALFERHVEDQIKAIEKTKLTAKKRSGVAPFVKHFPAYVQRMEVQLVGSNGLEIRSNVDAAYERIVDAMFEGLRQMAKLEGEGEDKDKGQLNYHVIIIENMHHFLSEISQLELGAMGGFTRRAQVLYEENVNAYVKIVLRRPFSKIMDYFDGVQRLLQTTAPTEIPNNTNYSKSVLKRVVKEYNGKDIKRLVEALFKRVEKHFAESTGAEEGGTIPPDSALAGVWKACEDETLAATERFNRLIAQCYSASNQSLEYTASDVKAAFKRR